MYAFLVGVLVCSFLLEKAGSSSHLEDPDIILELFLHVDLFACSCVPLNNLSPLEGKENKRFDPTWVDPFNALLALRQSFVL